MTRGSHNTVCGMNVMMARTTTATMMNGAASRTIDISGFFVMLATTKSNSPNGRCEKSDHDIDDHHDPKMHEINAERLCCRGS